MSYPSKTFELRVVFDLSQKSAARTKNKFMEWLSAHGIDEFVEGVMDGLDIDHEYTGPNERDFYAELGGELLPISVYKYNREFLEDLKLKIEKSFPVGISVNILSMETSEWLEGWKESFKPIESKFFYIYPPWDTGKTPKGKTPIVIEPGMAFGTGQHATTQVVLQTLERLMTAKNSFAGLRCMDVGTGTGILAIAAKKMGFNSVAGSDIDPDAVTAAMNNAKLNEMDLPLWQGSCPVNGMNGQPAFEPPFDVVIANILFVVLKKIIPDLSKITAPGGSLILSGLLIEDFGEMKRLAERHGLKLSGHSDLDGWSCMTFTKSSLG